MNSTLNGIPPVLVFQLEVYYKVDRLPTGLTAQQKETTARWYSNKTHLFYSNKTTLLAFANNFKYIFIHTNLQCKSEIPLHKIFPF